jgi:hypothetical protein
MTVVSVVNFGPSGTAVDVELFSAAGSSQGVATKTVLPGHPDVFMTDNDVQLDPFILDVYAILASLTGMHMSIWITPSPGKMASGGGAEIDALAHSWVRARFVYDPLSPPAISIRLDSSDYY